jgi:hypothetical protein
MKLVNAFCQRNKCLEHLIGSKTSNDSSNGDDDGSPEMSERWLYPSLLCTARQVPKSYMPLLLGSLIVRGDSVGPQEMRKHTAEGTAGGYKKFLWGGARKSNRRRNAR